MKIKTLNRGEAQIAMNEWIGLYPSLPEIDDEYKAIRKKIQDHNNQVRQQSTEKYYIDAQLGMFIYQYFWNLPEFNLRVAANDGFWRYLSLKVVPDVVAQRWGKDNSDHYWSKPTRIWLRSIWWYVHLSWQGDIEATRKVLETSFFTTDTILNFEERNGRKGTRVDVYRKIIKWYSLVPNDIVKKNSRGKSESNGKSESSDDLFRIVMKLNTAKMMVLEPELYHGGKEEYVKSLFKDVGVDFNVAEGY